MKILNSISLKKILLVVLIITIKDLWAQNSMDTLATACKKYTGLTVDELNKLTRDKYILVYLHADWCAVCKKQQPVIDKIIQEEKGRLALLDIDTDSNPLINEYFEVDGLPRIILYRKNVIVWQYLGLIQEKVLRDWIKCF